MDLIETSISEIKKLKIKDLKKLINEQKLFTIDKKDKKKDLIQKIENLKKEYEDSDESDGDTEMNNNELSEVIEKVNDMNLNKFEKKNLKQNYIIFNNNMIYEVCQILKDLVEECKFVFDSNSFYVKTIDKYLVSFIDMKIVDCYQDYNLLNEKFEIVININSFLKILDCKENHQNTKFIFHEDLVEIFFYNPDNDSRFDKFKLRYLDENLVNDSNNDHEFKFDNEIEMNSKYFSTICNKIKKFDDKLLFEIENNLLKLSSKNKTIETTNKLNNEYNDIKMAFLLKHILIFCKTEKFCENVKINFTDENYPIEFYYEMNGNILKYVITPQIIDDDFDEY